MYRLRMESCVLLGAALLAACSDRSTPTAPSVRPLAASTTDHSSYTWTFTCEDKSLKGWGMDYSLAWTETTVQNGVENTVVLSKQTYYHFCSDGRFTGTGARPAMANGFTGCVGSNPLDPSWTCRSWRFDPAGAFSATVTGSYDVVHATKGSTGGFIEVKGTLTVDS